MVKIVSWNVNSIRVRLPHLIELDKSVKPDIVMLQETKSTDENFPEEEISSLGYQIIKKGQKSYNGVAVLSKAPIKKITDTKLTLICLKKLFLKNSKTQLTLSHI